MVRDRVRKKYATKKSTSAVAPDIECVASIVLIKAQIFLKPEA